MTPGTGSFRLTTETVLWAGTGARPEARYLARELAPAIGSDPEILDAPTTPPTRGAVLLRLDPDAQDLGSEGYRLVVTPDLVQVTALKPAGLFYAAQTIRQLLPPQTLAGTVAPDVEWTIPAVTVRDRPRFPWRGHLLDVGRHFFTVEEVKRTIDLLALHKLNRFHWHLTDDQGWRLEIKRYPKLTEVGAWRKARDKEGERYGGFYTQDEVRDILAYAAERHVTVIPEIEMPGHTMTAIAGYPQLGCTGIPFEVPNDWGINREVYCAGQEQTYQFTQNVLDEVLALFPSPWIHIGGDEVPKDQWKKCPKCQTRIRAEGLKDEHELQSYFIRRIDKYLDERGRRLVGWDEILEGGLAPGAVVQSWRGVEGGIQAASAGHDVIMSPTSHCYLDYTYETISLEKAYGFEPIPAELSPDRHRHILGLEGNMWTELVPGQERYDFQTWPRMTALAEVAWSPKEGRNWPDFRARMAVQQERFRALGVKPGAGENLTTGKAR